MAGETSAGQNLTVRDILALPTPEADRRIAYGSGPLQFGDLRMPQGRGPHPVVVVIHGGCWQADYGLDHISSFCAALTGAGVTTWSLEYRRVGDDGGGWPGTFQDVAQGTDFLRTLAKSYPIDLDRVVVVGHSAGGHLALWLAGRRSLPAASLLHSEGPLPVRGVVSLAGIGDLEAAYEEETCSDMPSRLLGGAPGEVPDRYRQGSPIRLLPTDVPLRLVHGARDRIVPLSQSRRFEADAKSRGSDVRLIIAEEAAHFELIAPRAAAWPLVRDTILSLF